MLYFNFSNYKEFANRKNNQEFMNSVVNTYTKFKTYKRKEAKAKATERRTFVKEVQKRMFSVSGAVTAIRAELTANAANYQRLQITDAKQVSRAQLIVINDVVYCLKKVTLKREDWELIEVQNVQQVIKSLEQKAKLCELVEKEFNKGNLPEEASKTRQFVANLIDKTNKRTITTACTDSVQA